MLNLKKKIHEQAEFRSASLRRKLLLVGILGTFALAILFVSGIIPKTSVSAQQFVDLQEGGNPHAGFRRAHAKGICISGIFESSGALSQYSTASVFEAGATPFLGRFSIAGNNPTAPDLKAPVRSLAFAVNSESDQEWRVAMNTPPVMAVATPDAFFKQLQALSPDPVTKQRDPQKIKAFFAAHPESRTFNEWKASYTPTNSFATERYHSINAFYLIDDSGNKQAVRWVAVPKTVDSELPPLTQGSADALHNQLAKLLENGQVEFDMVFTLATDADDENNPTILWPVEREQRSAGTLVIKKWQAQQTGKCRNKNFDPLVLPDGMMATEDPILNARGSAYAESYRRRAKETLLGTNSSVD